MRRRGGLRLHRNVSQEGATHYVSVATLGAFVMATGSSANVEAAANFFGKGAGAGSASAREVHNKDGKIEDCVKAEPNAKSPPAQCASVLRLKMKALKESARAATEVASADAEGADEPFVVLGSMYWLGNGVDKDWKKSTAAHEAGCEKGSGRSCRYAGRAYRSGQGAK